MRNPDLHERTGQLDWNELRTVLAVARSGTLAGAARQLDVRHSTVFRRMENVERRLGARLFERSRQGWAPNAQGEAVAGAAAEMEEAALAAERAITGADARLEGVVRIATSELLAAFLLPRLLPRFLAEHPGVEVEVTAANRSVDLTRREADLALRATPEAPPTLVGRKVALLHYAVYAAKSLLGRRRAPPDLPSLPWIGYDESVSGFLVARWMRETFPHVMPRLRADSLTCLLRHAAAGAGVAPLPMFAAAQDARLVRITPPIEAPVMGLWVLSHPEVRGNARIRALAAFLAEAAPAELERIAHEDTACSPLAACSAPARGSRRKR